MITMRTANSYPARQAVSKRIHAASNLASLPVFTARLARAGCGLMLLFFNALACQSAVAVDMIAGSKQEPASLMGLPQTAATDAELATVT